jgi:hypothetical protein
MHPTRELGVSDAARVGRTGTCSAAPLAQEWIHPADLVAVGAAVAAAD